MFSLLWALQVLSAISIIIIGAKRRSQAPFLIQSLMEKLLFKYKEVYSECSTAEQNLLDWVDEHIGEALSIILLTLGFLPKDSEPSYLILTHDGFSENKYILTFEHLTPERFPSVKESLVILGLLRLILENDCINAPALRFPSHKLFGELEWRVNENKDYIGYFANALDLFFNLAFSIIEDERSDMHERTKYGFISRHRLITSYEIEANENGKPHLPELSFWAVCFDLEAVRYLRSKSIFGINWDKVVAIKAGTFEEFWNANNGNPFYSAEC